MNSILIGLIVIIVLEFLVIAILVALYHSFQYRYRNQVEMVNELLTHLENMEHSYKLENNWAIKRIKNIVHQLIDKYDTNAGNTQVRP